MILGLGLPDTDVVLSARRASGEKTAALDAGADDHVTEPFSMNELLPRLRAAVRRGRTAPTAPGTTPAETGDFTVDLTAKKVRRVGGDVRLPPAEWHLLEILVTHPGRLSTQKHLLHEVWGEGAESRTNHLRVDMTQPRRKLEADPSPPRYSVTEPGMGMGYRFEG
ncbi:response regulator [Streptomyces roseiscleroticus]